jgi:hypothetical protein
LRKKHRDVEEELAVMDLKTSRAGGLGRKFIVLFYENMNGTKEKRKPNGRMA